MNFETGSLYTTDGSRTLDLSCLRLQGHEGQQSLGKSPLHKVWRSGMRLGSFKSSLGTPRAGSTVPGSASWESLRCKDLPAPVPLVPRPARPLLPGAAGLGLGKNEPHLPRQCPPQQAGAERTTAGVLGPRRPPGVGCDPPIHSAADQGWVLLCPPGCWPGMGCTLPRC